MRSSESSVSQFRILTSVLLLGVSCTPLLAAEYSAASNEALLWAAERGNAPAILSSLKDHADPNAANATSRSALFLAVLAGSVPGVQALLDAGATGINESHQVNGIPGTPLEIAGWRGNEPLFELLLTHGANPALDDYGALRGAVVANAIPSCRQLLAGGISANWRFRDGESPMTIAAMRGYTGLLALLIDNQGNVNIRDNSGATPLILAAAQGQEGALEFLLKHGARVLAADARGETALEAAAHAKEAGAHERMVAELTAHGARKLTQNLDLDERFLLAAHHGDLAQVKSLLASGAELEVPGVPNIKLWLRNALSASVAHPPVCQYLLAQGINPYMLDSAGFSALHTAASEGHPECIKALIDRGLNPNAASQYGQTPLYMAINARRPAAVVAALLDGGADPNASEAFRGQSPVAAARARGLTEVVKLLQAKGGHE